MRNFCLWYLLSGTLEQRKWKKELKISNLTVDHFSLTIANLSLAWMLCFHIWLQNKGKFWVSHEYYNHFWIYQPSRLSFLVPLQGTSINPEEYSELSQASKMECFSKHSIWDIWQGSEYESVICYSLFGKIEDGNVN